MAGVPPKKNTAFSFYVTLTSQADTDIFQVNPTLAIGDVKVSTDGGALNNITTLPVVTPAGGQQVLVSLSNTEMNGDVIGVLFSDPTAEWQDLYIEILTDTQQLTTIVDDVWDEVLTSGTHNVGYSAGQRLRYLILTGATAQAGDANRIRLAATESAVDNIFVENIISIVSGTGLGQTRLICDYDGTTKWATVDKAWFTNPAAGSVYEILPFSSILIADHGLAQAGAATTITLQTTASATNDTYIGSVVYISSGTGAGQARVITDYDGAGKIATVSNAWTTNPGVTSVYKILPVGRVIVDSIAAGAIDDISSDVWAYSSRTLTQTAAQVTAAVSGSDIAVNSYTTWTIALTNMGSIADRTKLYFTAKGDPENDPDTAAIVQVEETAGLQYINGAVGTPANGSIAVTNAALGNITVTVNANSTGFGKKQAWYGVKKVTLTGVVLMCEGWFTIDAPSPRAIA